MPSDPVPAKVPGARSQWQTLKDLLPHLWPADRPDLRRRVVLAMVCLFAAKGAIVVVPLLYKQAVDALTLTGAAGGPPPEIVVPVFIILAYGAARVFSLSFQELRDFFFAKVGQRAIRQVALGTFKHLHGLSLQFHLDRQTGGLSRVIERGTKAIDTLLSFALFSILPTFVELGFSVAILWALYGIEVAAITLVTVSSYIVYTYRVTEWRLQLRREMNESDQQANTRAIDSLINYETVKYFANEAHEAARYDVGLRAYETAATASKTSLSILNIGQAAIIAAGVTALMLLSAMRVAEGTMTAGDFVAVNAYMMQLAQPLNFFGFVYREVKQSLVDMETMFQLLKVDTQVKDSPSAPDLHLQGGRIEFKNVHFAYDSERQILRGIDFAVPPGHSVAVVGPSGAGKSTLSRLLFRFYDVTEGRIEIDGQDLREITQASLRRAIGIVPQDTVLFNDTIGYNIAYGNPTVGPAEVERAADLAHIGSFVRGLPKGLESLVGERGLKLSGGEKQRVAIARTILKAPAILLFDEATSALDTQTEREIQANLREVSRGRTTLVIAHRLSTVVEADEILVLEAGQIVERGRHADLLAAGGVYAAMWQRQQEAEKGPAEDSVHSPV
ncbi:ABCB family ABC transporter ATP-binding protein/permease [Algihabitans albus]|uniref:ABCB family ABC transporter ATP-binding protein/permease n=1 Tax=Algihabitans albus TaxID=2164067 RepID=UPI000E5CE0C0|nr:ABC transporter ATP-binding protein/permease [Algihabitans albus]